MLEILSKVGFDWQVALANFVNFVVIFFVLKKFAFGPILKLIKERQEKINLGLEEAEKAKTNLLMSEEISKEHISRAKAEANLIILNAHDQGSKVINESKLEAENLKAKILSEGKEQIDSIKGKLHKEIQLDTSKLVIIGIEKILRDNLNKEQEKKYIESFLTD